MTAVPAIIEHPRALDRIGTAGSPVSIVWRIQMSRYTYKQSTCWLCKGFRMIPPQPLPEPPVDDEDTRPIPAGGGV